MDIGFREVILVVGGAVGGLGGSALMWNFLKKEVDKKVNRSECEPTHKAIREDLTGIQTILRGADGLSGMVGILHRLDAKLDGLNGKGES